MGKTFGASITDITNVINGFITKPECFAGQNADTLKEHIGFNK